MEQYKKILSSKEVILVSYAKEGPITHNHLKVRERELDVNEAMGKDGSSGNVLLQKLWVSVDPGIRQLMKQSNDGLYLHSFNLDQPISCSSISKVMASADPEINVGDIVWGISDVSEYTVVPAKSLRKVDTNAAPQSAYLGLLGLPGFTAWVGFTLIGNPKPGEQVFVTAAAGAVGLIVGQLAKIKGCRVVGSTGSDEKVRLLKEEFGFDEAFNYKAETDWDAALSRYFPKGIDIYFDNVGGRMLEAVLNHININARIPLCGMISQYNEDWKQRYGVRNLLNLVGKCAKVEGFMPFLDLTRMDEFIEEMKGYMRDGKVKYREDVKQGLESFLEAFNSVYSSANVGKTLLQLPST